MYHFTANFDFALVGNFLVYDVELITISHMFIIQISHKLKTLENGG